MTGKEKEIGTDGIGTENAGKENGQESERGHVQGHHLRDQGQEHGNGQCEHLNPILVY